ncbi:MAG TPA: IS1182 family transposase [Anaeromyxobacteraceae bacterium]|nr:IS1182 family transposase [Anaeromyxobacteraceae bacterium]
MERWDPKRETTRQEEFLLKRLHRTRKLFGFLRRHRHELFDDGFQRELESMYRNTGAGEDPVPPALLAMVVLLQSYLGTSDAEAVELAVVDLRWQMVLGCLGATEPPFSQGALPAFRERLIAHDMDRRLLERTVELARSTKEFDWKKLPKTLRVAIDSAPLEGAGRVEDTLNLLAHAARKVVECAADLLHWTPERVCREAHAPLLVASSIKAALDRDWSDPAQKAGAVKSLVIEIENLKDWLTANLAQALKKPPLSEDVATLQQVMDQDLEPDPDGGGVKIREGVAEDRRVSVEDPDMRHGRKSKTKRFNGYKRHIATDLDSGLILSGAITPANRPEEEAAPGLAEDIARQDLEIGELFIDRGYVKAALVDEVLGRGGEIVCRPWVARGKGVFSKAAFKINVRDLSITCPAGETENIVFGAVTEFDPEACDQCELRAKCTAAVAGSGRTVNIASDERLQQRLRKHLATPRGRARLRERVGVEHKLAHLARRQGRRARYRGVRKYLFDLRRASAIQNLEAIQRKVA